MRLLGPIGRFQWYSANHNISQKRIIGFNMSIMLKLRNTEFLSCHLNHGNKSWSIYFRNTCYHKFLNTNYKIDHLHMCACMHICPHICTSEISFFLNYRLYQSTMIFGNFVTFCLITAWKHTSKALVEVVVTKHRTIFIVLFQVNVWPFIAFLKKNIMDQLMALCYILSGQFVLLLYVLIFSDWR